MGVRGEGVEVEGFVVGACEERGWQWWWSWGGVVGSVWSG